MDPWEFFNSMDIAIQSYENVAKDRNVDPDGLKRQIDDLSELLDRFSDQFLVLKNIISTRGQDNADTDKLIQRHKELTANITGIVETLCA